MSLGYGLFNSPTSFRCSIALSLSAMQSPAFVSSVFPPTLTVNIFGEYILEYSLSCGSVEMSESSSDTESSCGWTIISNEGSDIETLGPENALEHEVEISERGPIQETELLDQSAFACAEKKEERGDSSLDVTLKAESFGELHSTSEVGAEEVTDEHVTLCSSSDHSDIVTLGDSSKEEQAEVEGDGDDDDDDDDDEEEVAAGSEDLYMGTSSSSQYTFSAPETGGIMNQWTFTQTLWKFGCRLREQLSAGHSFSVFPLEQPVVGESSSSDEEVEAEASPAVRRRRVRKSTAGSEPEEAPQQQPRDQAEALGEPLEHQDPRAGTPQQGHVSGTLNKCILLALVVAISMGVGHFYGTVQIQERQRIVERSRVLEPSGTRELHQCHRPQKDINKEVIQSLREDLEEKHNMVMSITGLMDKITKENQQLRLKQDELQAQKVELVEQLKQTVEERSSMELDQEQLARENRQLKSSLEHEEASLSALQDELRSLRAQIRQLEERGAGADSVVQENQRLKEHLEEERQRLRGIWDQRNRLVVEAQALRGELDVERKATDKLKEELSRRGPADAETEELQSRLLELEKKLSFEQQRSDLWERLYVETKEDRVKAKGDRQAKAKRPKEGIIGKVKETFDAVKNSTKEFVHHHKEQIKKAKEAVKENLRKFSDSVKSTFRTFKDSASTMFDRNRRPHERKYQERKESKAQRQEPLRTHRDDSSSEEASWQHRPHKSFHQHPRKSTLDSSSEAERNTRKAGTKKDSGFASPKGIPKGCSGVFDCAYQESMSLFNKAMDPIRADEFKQLLHSYLQQEVDHFHHWNELEGFIKNFFHNGVFIHDQMLFTDFVSGVEDYLEDMHEYHSHDDVFEDLDDYIYRHFFGDTYSKRYGPSRPLEGPDSKTKENREARDQRKHQRARPRPQKERKWSRQGRPDRHMADVKIELGPIPFDPKY
ncbi:cell cycle progression protein 1 isoform X2 [Alosa pseudoharengus]|uniref:cell cycle progression protein 1 isoform X2 n=1 Tax=Alosa pseudoharengus TaxID=34774 RepID=UPI003F8905A2